MEQINRYIYKLIFLSGKTYVGQRTYKCTYGLSASTDTYMGSSHYKIKHPEDPIIEKEILIENLKDKQTLDFLETFCIMSDKAYNPETNVNGNWGCLINVWGNFLSDEEKVIWKQHLSDAYHRLSPERKIERERKRLMWMQDPERHKKFVDKIRQKQIELNKNDAYRRSHSVTKNMSDDELQAYKEKMSMSSKNRKEIICIENSMVFTSIRNLSNKIKVNRAFATKELNTGTLEFNGYHYQFV